MSLKTGDLREAEYRADLAWQSMLAGWEAILCDDDQQAAELHFEQARLTAQRLGMRYIPAVEVAQLPRDELLRRIDAAAKASTVALRSRAVALDAETRRAAALARGKDQEAAKAESEAAVAREAVNRAQLST